MIFTASLDKVARGITIGVSVLFTIIIAFPLVLPHRAGSGMQLFVSVMVLMIFLAVYLLRPLQYEVTGDALIIHRPARNVTIARQNIVSAVVIDGAMLKNSLRVFGVGGLFGYFGTFTHRELGSMTWYATRRDKAVLLTTRDKRTIILSPDEPEMFVRHFH